MHGSSNRYGNASTLACRRRGRQRSLSGSYSLRHTLTVPDGFGRRLREERDRLGLSQAVLAEAGGVRRLAQSQYETEKSSPSVRYLAAIAGKGVDLQYVLFGREFTLDSASPNSRYRIEEEAFRMVEEFVQTLPDERLGAEARFALFQIFRAQVAEQAQLA